MIRYVRTRGYTTALVMAAALVPISWLIGCSSITGSDRTTAEAAQLTVEGSSTVPLLVITSTRFSTFLDPDGAETVSFVLADSTRQTLPIDLRVPFGTSDRVHFTVRNTDANVTASVNMRITVDGREVYRQAATLRDAALGFSYFLF